MTDQQATARTPHTLGARGATIGYGERVVLDGLDLDIPHGRVGAIIGANACGKSTLLRALARLLRPSTGAVLLDGREIHRLPTRRVARAVGLLPQSPVCPEGIVVSDLVARGRHPHQGPLSRWSTADDAAVARALERTGTAPYADRPVDELSGGQRQRVWIALALAQGTDILLLDEPTTYLDVAHQVEVLDLLADLNETEGTTIVMVLHDLNLACRYADWVLAMRDGHRVAMGAPADVVDDRLVRDVFGLEAHVVPDPVTGTPLMVPAGRHGLSARRERSRQESDTADPEEPGPAGPVGVVRTTGARR